MYVCLCTREIDVRGAVAVLPHSRKFTLFHSFVTTELIPACPALALPSTGPPSPPPLPPPPPPPRRTTAPAPALAAAAATPTPPPPIRRSQSHTGRRQLLQPAAMGSLGTSGPFGPGSTFTLTGFTPCTTITTVRETRTVQRAARGQAEGDRHLRRPRGEPRLPMEL